MDFRYTDLELEIIQNTFVDNKELLMTIRKHFLGGDLVTAEEIELEKIRKSDFYPVLKKVLLPQLDAESPLGQNVDMWVNINTKEKGVEEANLEMAARQIVIDYVTDRFRVLEGERENLKIEDLTPHRKKGQERNFVELSARNTILQHIDLQLNSLLVIAGQKKETAEEIKKRLAQNSAK